MTQALDTLLELAVRQRDAGLIALHIAGAIKHGLKRDGTVARMLPGGVFKN